MVGPPSTAEAQPRTDTGIESLGIIQLSISVNVRSWLAHHLQLRPNLRQTPALSRWISLRIVSPDTGLLGMLVYIELWSSGS